MPMPGFRHGCCCCGIARCQNQINHSPHKQGRQIGKKKRMDEPTGGTAYLPLLPPSSITILLLTLFLFHLSIYLSFSRSTGPLTATAECLTALHAVCRISAALPGFSRFLVNLRVDSAAISSSERSPPCAIQPSSWRGESGPGGGLPPRQPSPPSRVAPDVGSPRTHALAYTDRHADSYARRSTRAAHTAPVRRRCSKCMR